MNSNYTRVMSRCWASSFAAAIVALIIGTQRAVAQVSSPSEARTAEATRRHLETLSTSLQQRLQNETISPSARDSLNSEMKEIARRLQNGDFVPGDRVVLHVLGEPTLNDTLVVGEARTLALPGLEDIPLQGVLRSELRDSVRAHLARFLRNPQFSVTPLIRVAVLGEVTRPGFYSLSPDARITDAVMLAGGPTSNGDLGRLAVTRDGHPLLPEKQMRDIVARGMSLDLAGLAPGDAVVVGERGRRDTQIYFQAGTILLSAVSTLVAWSALSRRH